VSRALVLRHHDEDQPGLIAAALRGRGYEVSTYFFDATHQSPSLEGIDVLVVLGSKSAVYDERVQAAWFAAELEFLARADAAGIPVLGICFGAQALCLLSGGRVAQAAEPEVGWFTIEAREDISFPAGPWMQYHYDACQVSSAVEVLATSPRATQIFRWKSHLAVQFHPEVDASQLDDWFAADRSGEVSPEDAAAIVAYARAHHQELQGHADEVLRLWLGPH